MAEFAQISNIIRKDIAFSQFLRIANDISKDWHDFLLFSRWAGLDSFSNDDKQPYTTSNGDTIDSLYDRYICSIVRQTAKIAEHHNDNSLLQWGKEILTMALANNPDNIWLNYYQTKIHLTNNDFDLAIKYLMPVMQRQMKASWAWALLGEAFDNSQPQNSLLCYIYANQLGKTEQEIAKIRITLAHKLASYQRYAEASFQVQKAVTYRQKTILESPLN